VKLKNLIFSILILSSSLYALSPYVKGYKAYIRYVKRIPKHGIKAPELLKKLNVKNEESLEELFKNNGKLLIEKTKQFNPKAAKGLEKIIEKGKLKELKTFLLKVLNGKVPLGCR